MVLDSQFFIDIIPYYFLVIISAFSFQYLDNKKAFFLVSFTLMLFAGMRYDLAWDYWNYYNAIKYNTSLVEDFELFERFLIYICQKLEYPQLFFMVNAFFTVLFTNWGIKKMSINPKYSYLVYICIPVLYLSSLSTVRYALAMSMIFWGLSFLENKKPFKYIIILTLSFLVHQSSLIAILFIPLYYVKINRINNVILYIVFFFFSNIIIGLIPLLGNLSFMEKYTRYVNLGFGQAFNILPIIFNAINVINLVFYNIIVNNGVVDKNEKIRISRYITIFNVSCIIMQMFSYHAVLSTRLSRYFLMIIILLVPYYIKNNRLKFLIKTSIISFLLLFYFMQFTLSNYNGGSLQRKNVFIPYKIYLNKGH